MILIGNEINIFLWGVATGFGLLFLGVIAGVLVHSRITQHRLPREEEPKVIHKQSGRTEREAARDARKLERHTSVINIDAEDDEIVYHMENTDDEPEDKLDQPEYSSATLDGGESNGSKHEEETTGSLCHTPSHTDASAIAPIASIAVKPPQNWFHCDNPLCNSRGKNAPASDGKHYCGKHGLEVKG